MKALNVSEDVLPIGEFKTHASRVLRKLRAGQRPVLITQNGRPAAVLITPEEFDRIRENDQFTAAVREGLADSEAGRVIDDAEMGRMLDREFGPAPRR